MNEYYEKPFYQSKKWWAMILGVSASLFVAAMTGEWAWAAGSVLSVLGYEVGQGMADFGKQAPRQGQPAPDAPKVPAGPVPAPVPQPPQPAAQPPAAASTPVPITATTEGGSPPLPPQARPEAFYRLPPVIQEKIAPWFELPQSHPPQMPDIGVLPGSDSFTPDQLKESRRQKAAESFREQLDEALPHQEYTAVAQEALKLVGCTAFAGVQVDIDQSRAIARSHWFTYALALWDAGERS